MYSSHVSNIVRCSLVGLLVLFACADPSAPSDNSQPIIEGQGGVFIAVDQSSVPPEVVKIVAVLDRPGFSVRRDSLLISNISPDSSILVLTGIPSGPWSLSVKAYDALDVERYSGSAQVVIMKDAVTGVSVTMKPSSAGVGTLVISLIWETSRPSPWTMSQANPVLMQSDTGWDRYHYYVSEPFVLYDDGQYRMWYTTGVNAHQAIAAAVSPDGIHWRKQGIVIDSDPTDANRAAGASSPSVVRVNGTYHMWFNGKISYDIPHGGIRHATSSDGLLWTVDPMHAIPLASPATGIFGVNVVRMDSLLRMYYSVETTTVGSRSYAIHLAESFDGYSWYQQGAVLTGRSFVPWEQGGVYTPHVLYRRGQFVMYYTAGNTSGGASIGRAVSSNGVQWTPASTEPEFGPTHASPWGVLSVGYPTILEIDGKLNMWFAGLSRSQNRWQIGLATQE